MKLLLSNAKAFGWTGLKGWAYNSKEDFANASAAYFEVSNHHGRTMTNLSDRIYYVIEGEGDFTLNDKTLHIQPSDVVIIPKGTFYDYHATKGNLKLFLVHVPAYDPAYEIKD